MVAFSGAALYLTTLWNAGFKLNFQTEVFIKTVIITAALYYLIFPFAKLVLMPLNVITLGLAGLVVYFLLFHFFLVKFSLISITSWTFPGLYFIGKTQISYMANVAVSAFSVSTIINFFEKIL